MNWKHWSILLFGAALLVFFFRSDRDAVPEQKLPLKSIRKSSDSEVSPREVQPRTSTTFTEESFKPSNVEKEPPPATPKKFVAPYTIEDGLIVVAGDIVIGAPASEDYQDQGLVEVPQIQLWESTRIPYHIQPDLPRPERVHEALQMFAGSGFTLTPFQNEKDALVFQRGTGVCKSYVGRIGGHQPIWLSESCGPAEVAHEIMHALGFIHEQNRVDRDQAVMVDFDEIEASARFNFEKFPESFMQVSGLSEFDFNSIMIYPDHLFAKGSRPTMRPRTDRVRIEPSSELSPKDLIRLRQLAALLEQRH